MDIRDVSLRFLTYRSRASGEMKKHLKDKGFSSAEIAEEMEFLLDLHYIDDFEYVRQYSELAFSKGKGFARIKRELLEKGISKDALLICEEERDDLRGQERERALLQGKKLAAQARELDDKFFAKVGRRLISLGYGSDTIYYVIGVLKREKNDGAI